MRRPALLALPHLPLALALVASAAVCAGCARDLGIAAMEFGCTPGADGDAGCGDGYRCLPLSSPPDAGRCVPVVPADAVDDARTGDGGDVAPDAPSDSVDATDLRPDLPADATALDSGADGDATVDVPSDDVACWPKSEPCADGLRVHDGCRCRIPPTGVTTCWTGDAIGACDPSPESEWYGQDGHFPGGEAGGLLVHADGDKRVKDDATSLRWTVAQWTADAWTDPGTGTCTPEASCKKVAGTRVPTAGHLLSIVDFGQPGCDDEALWPTPFDAACSVTRYWSSTVPPGATTPVLFDFADGRFASDVDAGGAAVRCVYADAAKTPATDRFTALGDVVVDRMTGLVWSAATSAATWKTALAACRACPDGDWRLPDVKELASLVAWSRKGACRRDGAFDGSSCGTHWTSTPRQNAAAGAAAFAIDFSCGFVTFSPIGDALQVRCVRDIVP